MLEGLADGSVLLVWLVPIGTNEVDDKLLRMLELVIEESNVSLVVLILVEAVCVTEVEDSRLLGGCAAELEEEDIGQI